MTASYPATVWNGLSDNQLSRQDNKSPDYRDWDRLVEEVIAMQSGGAGSSAVGTPNGTGVSITTSLSGNIVQQTLTFLNVAISIASSAVGFGSLKILDPPAGNIHFLGAHGNLTLSTTGVNLDADADLIASVGSVAAADDTTLTSTEANIVPSTAFTLVTGTKTAVVNSTAAVTLLNPDVYLNIVAQDVDRTDTAQDVIVNGTLTLTYINLGNG